MTEQGAAILAEQAAKAPTEQRAEAPVERRVLEKALPSNGFVGQILEISGYILASPLQ